MCKTACSQFLKDSEKTRPRQMTDAVEAKPVKAAKERTARPPKATKTPQDDVRSFLEVPIQDITRDPLVEAPSPDVENANTSTI
jgi:hypothetical protein